MTADKMFNDYKYYYDRIYNDYNIELPEYIYKKVKNYFMKTNIAIWHIDNYLNVNCLECRDCIACIQCRKCEECIGCIDCLKSKKCLFIKKEYN